MTLTQRHLIAAARALSRTVGALTFSPPVAFVYNPLSYARIPHEAWLAKASPCPILFLGMNPGPFGMAQTGVPFGEVAAVRDWLGVSGAVERPRPEHPKRPILGFSCPRSEVSGRRLWGLFRKRYGSAAAFLAGNFVANYVPLVFMEAGGRNLTPEKLPASEREGLYRAADTHLRAVTAALGTETLVGVGAFAARQAAAALHGLPVRVVTIAHPSPANPAANRDWDGLVTRQLVEAGIWDA